jgi:acylphosphatase
MQEQASPATYSTDIEGGRPVRMHYAISGRMRVPSYLAFVAERATWLGLAGWAQAAGRDAVTVVAAGPEALVGALEMACTLGPLDALIDRIDARAEPLPVAPGFRVIADQK